MTAAPPLPLTADEIREWGYCVEASKFERMIADQALAAISERQARETLSLAADDANLSRIAAEEELELLRKNNLQNCLQITALQEALISTEQKLALKHPNFGQALESADHWKKMFNEASQAREELAAKVKELEKELNRAKS